MAAASIDYDQLAQQHGGTATVDYDALAAQHGGTAQNVPSASQTPEPEGFWHSLGAQFGLTPEAAQAALQNEKDHPIKTAILKALGPAGMAGKMLYDQAAQSGGQLVQAAKDYEGGNPAQAGIDAINAVPIVGPGMVKATNQYAGGDLAGAAGTMLGIAGQAAPMVAGAVDSAAPERPVIPNPPVVAITKNLGAKLVPSLVDGPPESLMTRAIKPGKNNVAWNADVRTATPLMKSAEEQLGHPIQGVDDALEAANLAKKQVWQQYQARLGPAAQRGAVIDGNQIADAMMDSIDRRTAIQNPALVQKVQQIADTYRRPLSLGDAEDFLQSANKDLNSYYAKNKVGQQVALNDPEMSATVAEAQALRNGLYSKLDQLTGPGAAQLKQAYGSLTNMEKELYGRQLVAARQNPESLAEQLSTVRGAGKIAKGILTASPGDVLEGAQNIAVSRALKARNSTDAMITRAFEKASPAVPFPTPKINLPIAGALPATTGGPIELPYVPEMEAGERIAALQQALRQSMPPALPARVLPLRLPPPQ